MAQIKQQNRIVRCLASNFISYVQCLVTQLFVIDVMGVEILECSNGEDTRDAFTLPSTGRAGAVQRLQQIV